jgi:hypothetical protein
MGFKKVLRILFQIPVWLLLIVSLVGSIYGYYAKISGITLATPIILFLIISLYFIGRVFLREKNEENQSGELGFVPESNEPQSVPNEQSFGTPNF